MESEPRERYWTSASIDALAERLKLRNDPDMQDWPWQVADSARIDEFMAAFEEFKNDPDVRYTLMDVLIQSFEELDVDLRSDQNWQTLLTWLERDFETHAYQVWYWSGFENEDLDDWRVSPFLRQLWARRHTEV